MDGLQKELFNMSQLFMGGKAPEQDMSVRQLQHEIQYWKDKYDE